MSGHYYFVEKLKTVEKQLCKLNSFYGKVSLALKLQILNQVFEIEALKVRVP